jgi:hypothetical protein
LNTQNYTTRPACKLKHSLLLCACALYTNVAIAQAQSIEVVGSRALGMGGAFVAVASDSSATWWNPAGLASGPFLDVAQARAVTESRGGPPAHRDTATWFALGTPPFGMSYYRLKITEIRPVDSTVTESGSREDRRAGVPLQSLSASQFGITLIQSLTQGFHAGATLKYVRGTVRTGVEDASLRPGVLLDRGDELEGGESDGAFGIDVGLMAVGGPLRLGLLVRNAVESELQGEASADPANAGPASTVRLERHFRAGLAYDASAGGGRRLVVAIDADLSTLAAASGDRRNVAVGVEGWLWRERLGVRGGARFNRAGAKERAATAGLSVVVRSGLFLDAHAVGGGSDDDRGWGVAARVSF